MYFFVSHTTSQKYNKEVPTCNYNNFRQYFNLMSKTE